MKPFHWDRMMGIKPILFLATLFITLLPDSLKSQTLWTNYSGNPLINREFDPGAIATARPSVLFDGDSYHMWYSSIRVFPIQNNQLHLGCMGYATSNDGISWQSVNPVAMGPAFDANAFDMFAASQGWVIADRDTFKMWYRGANPTANGIAPQSIGYAWSIDGSNWTRVKGPGILGSVYDSDMAGLPDHIGLARPCVVKEGGTYHMWHSLVLEEFFRIGYATSPDGIHWTKVSGTGRDGAVIDGGGQGRFDQISASWPAVIKTDEGFMMWYSGFDGSTGRTGCSVSTDGIHWNLLPGESEFGACFGSTQGMCVLQMDSRYHMWYAPGDSIQINLAFSDDQTAVKNPSDAAILDPVSLDQNFPNPFNPSTIIEYVVREPGKVTLVVYDGSGIRVGKALTSYHHPGTYAVMLNLQEFSPGIYFYKLITGDYQVVKKMVKSE